MAPRVSTVNGVRVYNVTSSKKLPGWLSERNRRKLQKDDEYLERVELLQDVDYPGTLGGMAVSPDGDYMVSYGGYPPEIRCYELRQLTLKFARRLDSEVVDLGILSPDYSKLVMLRADRYVEFHARYGRHFVTRIPTVGRCLGYHRRSADLIVAGTGTQVYRLNLEEGRFMAPLSLSASWQPNCEGVNCLRMSPLMEGNLAALGCDDGQVSVLDLRTRGPAGCVDAYRAVRDAGGDPAGDGVFGDGITAINFHGRDPTKLTAGTSGGQVLVYDLRSSKPLRIVDHYSGTKIVHADFHDRGLSDGWSGGGGGKDCLVSADRHRIKVWNPEAESRESPLFCTLEPENAINQVCMPPLGRAAPKLGSAAEGGVGGLGLAFGRGGFDLNGDADGPSTGRGGSGLVLVAGEEGRMESFFVPDLGPAPIWCSYLENLTEEIDGAATEGNNAWRNADQFDNYKFLTRDEVENLGLDGLIGTEHLKPYMHGFYAEYALWRKARQAANPVDYDAYRKQRRKEKEEKEGRIAPEIRVPKVNREAFLRLSQGVRRKTAAQVANEADESDEEEEEDDGTELNRKGKANKKLRTKGKVAESLLKDERFSALFTDEAFQIDENSEEFKQLYPSGLRGAGKDEERKTHRLARLAEEDSEDEDRKQAASAASGNPSRPRLAGEGKLPEGLVDESVAQGLGGGRMGASIATLGERAKYAAPVWEARKSRSGNKELEVDSKSNWTPRKKRRPSADEHPGRMDVSSRRPMGKGLGLDSGGGGRGGRGRGRGGGGGRGRGRGGPRGGRGRGR